MTRIKGNLTLVGILLAFICILVSYPANAQTTGTIGTSPDKPITRITLPAQLNNALNEMTPQKPPAIIKTLGEIPIALYPPILTFLIGSLMIIFTRLKSGESIAPAALLKTLSRKIELDTKATWSMRKRDNQRKLDLRYIVDNLNVWRMVEGRYPNAMDAQQHSEFLVALPRVPHDPLEGRPLKDFPVRYGYYYDNIDHDGKHNKMTFRLWTYLEDKNDPALELSQAYQNEISCVLLVTQDTKLEKLFPGTLNTDNNDEGDPNETTDSPTSTNTQAA